MHHLAFGINFLLHSVSLVLFSSQSSISSALTTPPLSPSPLLLHQKLKTYLFQKSFAP